MKFTPVNDLPVCGDDGRCEPGFQCSRPMDFDGPFLCLQEMFLEHDFVFPFTISPPIASTTVPTLPSTESAVASASHHHFFVIALLSLCCICLMLITFFVAKTYKKVHRPVRLIQSQPPIIRPSPDVPAIAAVATAAAAPAAVTTPSASIAAELFQGGVIQTSVV
uniref:EGF-like domain-containing protein n=1 Tax=Panagrolaimus sp. PS1159 TaxID=55785 RepID=A0AC35G2K2_9BILA